MSLSQVNYVEIHAHTWDYGFTLWIDGMQFEPCSPVTGVKPISLPEGMALMNYPNPFSETTTIVYHLADAGPVKLEVYDSRGTRMLTLVDQYLPQGDYEIEWRASRIKHPGSGIYLLKLATTYGIITRKILLIK
jgi:hypothetical protein